jgi:DNA-binding MarR family transcriptional regulator
MGRDPRRLTPAERRAWAGLIRLTLPLIRRLGRELQRDSGLSGPDYEVLVSLDNAPEGRMRVLELAAAMEWEKSRLSKHLSRMVARGHVTREPVEDDSRGAAIVITDAGRRAFEKAEPIHLDHVRELFLSALTRKQLEAFGELMDTVLAHIEAIDRAGALSKARSGRSRGTGRASSTP